MRKVLSCAAMAAMIVLAWSADGATTVQKAPVKKATAKTKPSAAKTSLTSSKSKKGTSTASSRKPGTTTTKSAASHGKKTTAKRGVTWRNRQMSPSPDRYREIQGALAAKGFLQPGDATGSWNQVSSDALKKFQAEQNLESSGKINSLSLIALGLGPRRDPAPPAPPRSTPQVPGQ
jgi:hypothetical protein